MTDYEALAENFLKTTSSKINWKINGISDRFNVGYKTLEYTFTISRGNRHYSGLFNTSQADLEKAFPILNNPDYRDKHGELLNQIEAVFSKHKKYMDNRKIHREITKRLSKIPTPTDYDLLACLNVDYSEDFNEFLTNYGYEIRSEKDYLKTKNMYEAVKKESEALQKLYTDDELELLHDIG